MNICTNSFGNHAPSKALSLVIKICQTPPFNRGSLRSFAAHKITQLAGGKLDIWFRNCAYRISDMRNPIEGGMLLYSNYNANELNFLIGGIRNGGTAIDLGANIGMYTLPMAIKAGEKGTVLAIDASSEFLEKLAYNAQATPLENIIIENVAVGDREGNVRLKRIEKNPGTAEVREDANGKIRMCTLFSILRNHDVKKIDAMKVDIDGFEDKALVPFFNEASDELLPQRIVIEHLMMDGGRDTCLGAMKERGYKLIGKTRSNSLFQL